MIRPILLLASVLMIGTISAKPPVPVDAEALEKLREAFATEKKPASLEASATLREAMAEATSVNVYEGLPHQRFEHAALAEESKRKDTKKIASFPFYTPSLAAKNPQMLSRTLSSADSIKTYTIGKRCGGFHPDYAIEWNRNDGSQFFALICLGCQEVIYSDGNKEFRYDLALETFKKLRKELAAYAKKRPDFKG